jgi:hypothetical protein
MLMIQSQTLRSLMTIPNTGFLVVIRPLNRGGFMVLLSSLMLVPCLGLIWLPSSCLLNARRQELRVGIRERLAAKVDVEGEAGTGGMVGGFEDERLFSGPTCVLHSFIHKQGLWSIFGGIWMGIPTT